MCNVTCAHSEDSDQPGHSPSLMNRLCLVLLKSDESLPSE